MVDILLGVWAVSIILSILVVAMNFYVTRRRLDSPQLKVLNLNLAKIQLYWSNTNTDFQPLTPDAVEIDRGKTIRNTFLMGLLGLASLPGFLLLAVVSISIHFLARTRKETATFRSPLVSDSSLSDVEVENLVRRLSGIV